MVPTAIKHIYQTPHNHQTVSKGVREKQCLLPWNTSTKQSANSQQGTYMYICFFLTRLIPFPTLTLPKLFYAICV